MSEQSISAAEHLVRRAPWIVLAIAGAMASLGGMSIVHFLVPAFTLPQEFTEVALDASAAYMSRYKSAYSTMILGNSITAIGIIGAISGLVLGLIMPVGSRITSALKAALAAGFGGVVGGAAGGYIVANTHFLLAPGTLSVFSLDPMIQSLLVQFLCWGTVGLALAVSLACCRPGANLTQAALCGLVGGVFATVLHNVIGALAFPGSMTMQVVPSSMLEKLLWASGSGLCLGLSVIPISSRKRDCNSQNACPKLSEV